MSLVDENKQWFKAKVGVDVLETPRDWSFAPMLFTHLSL